MIYYYNEQLLHYKWEEEWVINPSEVVPVFKEQLNMSLKLKPLLISGVEPVVTLASNYFFAFFVAILVKIENNQ